MGNYTMLHYDKEIRLLLDSVHDSSENYWSFVCIPAKFVSSWLLRNGAWENGWDVWLPLTM
jgi:hypothetical protein